MSEEQLRVMDYQINKHVKKSSSVNVLPKNQEIDRRQLVPEVPVLGFSVYQQPIQQTIQQTNGQLLDTSTFFNDSKNKKSSEHVYHLVNTIKEKTDEANQKLKLEQDKTQAHETTIEMLQKKIEQM